MFKDFPAYLSCSNSAPDLTAILSLRGSLEGSLFPSGDGRLIEHIVGLDVFTASRPPNPSLPLQLPHDRGEWMS